MAYPSPRICALLLSIGLFWGGCDSGPSCREPQGRWSNREGQVFEFLPDGKTLWMTRFGSTYDTVRLHLRTDCSQEPVAIDMSDFSAGPFRGQKLYGILEWSSDTTFRMLYESGESPEVRPTTFESDLTQKFFRE